MLFNSLQFVAFAIIVCVTFFSIPYRYRWIFLLGASYFFYMSWQPGYAVLIAFTTLVSYLIGLRTTSKNKKANKYFLWLSLIINLGVLFFFKYFNFLNDTLRQGLVDVFNFNYGFEGFDILLPVGISFYTFQTISYNIDVFYGLRKPEKHLGVFALYVSFFPQLVAGPIERSTSLMPQFHKKTSFTWERFNGGMKYLIWGFFKKVVIADRLSVYVNQVYDQSETLGGGILLFATVIFAFQLYCDFSAYSDIAKGISRILGYDLMENFDHPFRSKNISEFWRRWHISLSSWLRDYLFTPIMFKRKKWGKWGILYAIFITFLLCGLWHGARLTFVVFGLIQAVGLVFELATIERRKKLKAKFNERLYNVMSTALTFTFILLSFIFFRADDMGHATDILGKIFSLNYPLSEFDMLMGDSKLMFVGVLTLLVGFVLFDKKIFNIVKNDKEVKPMVEQLIFGTLVAFIVVFGYYGEVEFIYFQF